MKGGHRLKKKIKDRQAMLIDALYKRQGGVTKIAKKIDDVTPQDLINWRNRGKVPLKYCRRVANALYCSGYALNFEDVCFYYQSGIDWNSVVHGCMFSVLITDKLLNKEK